VIKTININKLFDKIEVKTRALENINIEINNGEFIAITGPSGSGKTSLLNLIGLLDTIDSGNLFFDGVNVSNLNERARTKFRRENIGFIFQDFNLIEELTIFENIELPLLYLGIKPKERKSKVLNLLEKINLQHKKKSYPKELSGCQQQKVAIARAVISSPKIILADEPTGNLDSHSSEEIISLLQELNSEGATILIVTHSALCAEKSQRIIRIFDGKIVTENITKPN